VNGSATASDEPGRRLEVLQVLKAASAPMTIARIADELGLHPNTVRFHLDILVGEGRIERAEPEHKGPGRPPLMFRRVRRMDRGGPRSYQLLAEILAVGFTDDENPSAKAFAAGRSWGQKMNSQTAQPVSVGVEETIDHLVDFLDDLGFAPERRGADGAEQIGLWHCPFLELAETRRDVICPIHLGLMQGALETDGGTVTVERLDAFIEPDLCLAHLSLQTPA
jgi:predicted ArsR family transcriptional regulator